MKKFSRFVLLILVCFVMCLPISVQAKVKLSASNLYITKGKSATLKITGSKKKVKWKSSNKKIAKVTSKGKVTGVKKGSATITAQIGKKKYKCKVTVETPSISRTSVVLDSNLDKDKDSFELQLKGTKRAPRWYTSNANIASISPEGVLCDVDAENPGTCIVSARLDNVVYSCIVRVVSTPENVDVDFSKLDFGYDLKDDIYQVFLGVNQTAQLSYRFFPANVTVKPAVTWTSSNSSIVSVNKSGKIQSHKAGKATITLKAGQLTDKIQVVVEQPSFSPDRITLDRSEDRYYEMYLKNCNTSNVIWSVSDSNIMTLENSFDNFASFYLKNPGTCTVYATAYGVKYSCKVTVNASMETLSFTTVPSSMKEGESYQTAVSYAPEDATNLQISYVSSDPEVVKVDSKGNVTALSVGTAKIRAISGQCSDECEITVVQNYDEEEALKSLTYKTYEMDDQVIVLIKNNYKYPLSVKTQATFMDKQKMVSKVSEGEELYIAEGESMICSIDKIRDSSGNVLDYDEYELVLKPKQTNAISRKDDLKFISSDSGEHVRVTLSSVKNMNLSCKVAIVFHQNDHILKYESQSFTWNSDMDCFDVFFKKPTDIRYDKSEPVFYNIFMTAY